jgi:SAM-dependent methyltransferase
MAYAARCFLSFIPNILALAVRATATVAVVLRRGLEVPWDTSAHIVDISRRAIGTDADARARIHTSRAFEAIRARAMVTAARVTRQSHHVAFAMWTMLVLLAMTYAMTFTPACIGRAATARVKARERVNDVRFGALGPRGTSREGFRYYDAAYMAARMLAPDAASALEVGCVKPAFVDHLTWIPSRACVSPYFAGYKTTTRRDVSDERDDSTTRYVQEDWMTFDETKMFDVVVSMQVVEHVDDPGAFVKKLLRAGKVVIVSVPYKWPDCGVRCSHKSHDISFETMRRWSGRAKPTLSIVIRERDGGAARLVVAYETNSSNATDT